MIPAYNDYIKKSYTSACISEVKAYSNNVFYLLNEQTFNHDIGLPVLNSCQSMTDASQWTPQTRQQVIRAVAKPPSNEVIECDLPNGVPCRVIH